MALYGKETLRKLQLFVDEGKPFKAGNISGKVFGKMEYIPAGLLTPLFRDLMLVAQRTMCGLHVCYSYETPIGWRSGEWVIPPVKYSVTTTHHQGRLKVAGSNPGFYLR